MARGFLQCGTLLLVAGCGWLGPPHDSAPLVLVVSWDTTRADALGCYRDVAHWGADLDPTVRPIAQTPVADGLCAAGQRFTWALAHAPTTLNSHASVFTGLDPHGTHVPRNGFPVPAALPLLTERFADAGWDTIAVVGASVLEPAMGLDRGFRVYDAETPRKVRRRFERSAPEVVTRALELVDARPPDRPLFLFVHVFDAHSPWEADPAQFDLDDPLYKGTMDGSSAGLERLIQATRAGHPPTVDRIAARRHYLAEVAQMDRSLGVLMEGLRVRKTGPDQLIVLFGDHGEALGETQVRPYGHGIDVDLEVVHVPLIVQGSGRFAVPPGQVDTPVGLGELAPTVLSLVGLPGVGTGRDLSAAWTGTLTPAPVFAEATKPSEHEDHKAWNNLGFERGVAGDGRWLTVSPWEASRQVQWLREDSRPVGIHGRDEVIAAGQLQTELQAWDRTAPPHRAVALSDDTREALKALGYLE